MLLLITVLYSTYTNYCGFVGISSLMELWETGLTNVWTENEIPKADQCFAKEVKSSILIRPSRIKLVDLTSAFLILGIGSSLAILSFVMETIAGVRNRHRQTEKITKQRVMRTTASNISASPLFVAVVELGTICNIPQLLELTLNAPNNVDPLVM